jgi:LPPG:FO 2-phospho-L-lactate transferase
MTQRRFILALAGGVGGGKFAHGLSAVLPPEELAIVVNTADDFVHLGLHISPDVDSVLYALADRNDPERGWGLAGETWNVMAALERLGGETWFRLGDRDLATHLFRTAELAAGRTLSEVTAALAHQLGIRHAVVPMSDAAVRSIVETDAGLLDFQDYFVRRKCEPQFRGVRFQGTAAPSTAFRAAIERATAIVIAPSNPYVSIDPILALEGVAGLLRGRRVPVVAVSPIVGGRAIKGPLAKMMREQGVEPSAVTIARHYGSLIGGWIIDELDHARASAIEALGRRVRVCDTIMSSLEDKARVARAALELADALADAPVE